MLFSFNNWKLLPLKMDAAITNAYDHHYVNDTLASDVCVNNEKEANKRRRELGIRFA